MPVTENSQTIYVYNGLISTAQQVLTLYNQIGILANQWKDQETVQNLNFFATVELNNDGSLGDPDPTPIQTNPIDPEKYPTISRSLSVQQITQIKSVLDDLVAYINGQVVNVNPGARAILNSAMGG